MNNSKPISIALSPAQVDQVVREAAQGGTPGFAVLIANRLRLGQKANDSSTDEASDHDRDGDNDGDNDSWGYLPVDDDDARLSRSLMRGLSILTCFGPDNKERGIIEMAHRLGMSPSTTHRYVSTLVELGLLERMPRTRKYRLVLAAQNAGKSAKRGASGRVKQNVDGSAEQAADKNAKRGKRDKGQRGKPRKSAAARRRTTSV
jgi:hypothetical protein